LIGDTYFGWGKPGLKKGWEAEIDWCVRVGGDLGGKSKNGAARAQFWLTKHRGTQCWVERTYLGWGKRGLKGWEAEIDWHTRVGGILAKNQKLSHWDSVFMNRL
jgi:hypothetical protein